MDERLVVAIDLGGTKAALALVSEDGRLIRRMVRRAPTGSPTDAVGELAALTRRWPERARVSAVGMALPAIVDPDGSVAWAAASVARWQDAPVKALLETAFGMPAAVRFDGYAATLGEATYGAGRGARSLAALIVGTGFGAGVWVDGRVLEGITGVAGAVGWTRWPTAGQGLSEPAESLASGSGILREANRRSPEAGFSDTRAVFRAARAGHPAARSVVHEAAVLAGTVAGAVVNVIAPEVVVWTGGVGSRADFSAIATRTARRCCQPFARDRTRFIRSRLGAESSLMGAAAAALRTVSGRFDP
jgi:predicted NBD/HSP70 family sugar kinase